MSVFQRARGLTWCSGHADDSFVAVITGAAGGIGSAFSDALARPGATLHLIDADADGLRAVAARGESVGAIIRCHHASVTDEAAVKGIAEQIEQPLTYLVTCAGIMHIGTARDSTLDQARRIIDTNLWGTITTVTAFLDSMEAAQDAHLIAISSGLGLMALPDYSAYAASKYGIRGFTEALRQEMVGRHVTVTTVYPGCVSTPIIRRSTAAPNVSLAERDRAFKRLAKTTPATVTAGTLKAAHAGRERAVIGPDARAGDLLARALPGTYHRVITRLAHRDPRQKS